jgi:hypothetical protein
VFEVERRAAEFFGTEDAFYFGSGYLANHILVSALAPHVDTVLVDEAAHYCVTEAARLAGKPCETFRHRDADDLALRVRGMRRVLGDGRCGGSIERRTRAGEGIHFRAVRLRARAPAARRRPRLRRARRKWAAACSTNSVSGRA